MAHSVTSKSIRSALKSGAIEFWFQPKVSFFSGQVCGGEALIRWRLPNGTVLPAAAWLPIAEELGVMQEIALAKLPDLYRDIAKILDATRGITISFNMEAADIESEEIIDSLIEAAESGLIDAKRVEVELLESALAEDQEQLVKNMKRIAEAGMSLAMDDFGTGYSSLDTLRKLPFSTVKIDQGVVMSLQKSDKSAAIVFSSIRMAYEMGMNVVAEGIESEEIFDFLQLAGCNEAQGFLISEALPLEEFLTFTQEGKRWQATPIGKIRHIEIDHLLWSKNLLTTVFGEPMTELGSKQCEQYADHFSCRMGRWLTEQREVLSSLVEFRNLRKPHADVHQAASNLILAARSGATSAELRSLANEFNICSSELLHRMQDLEIRVLSGGLPQEELLNIPPVC